MVYVHRMIKYLIRIKESIWCIKKKKIKHRFYIIHNNVLLYTLS